MSVHKVCVIPQGAAPAKTARGAFLEPVRAITAGRGQVVQRFDERTRPAAASAFLSTR